MKVAWLLGGGCLLLLAVVYVGGGILHDRISRPTSAPSLSIERPTLILGHGLKVHISLSNGPSTAVAPYGGLLAPTVLITYDSPTGGVQNVLNYAEVEVKSSVGADLCQKTLIYDSFSIVSPPGGASNGTANVTYASNTYVPPFIENLPNGKRCAAWVLLESDWEVRVCFEGDGRLGPGPDLWDACISQPFHGHLLPFGVARLFGPDGVKRADGELI